MNIYHPYHRKETLRQELHLRLGVFQLLRHIFIVRLVPLGIVGVAVWFLLNPARETPFLPATHGSLKSTNNWSGAPGLK